MNKIFLLLCIVLPLSLSGCALNDGFPREVSGDLQPINSQKVIKDVESNNT